MLNFETNNKCFLFKGDKLKYGYEKDCSSYENYYCVPVKKLF